MANNTLKSKGIDVKKPMICVIIFDTSILSYSNIYKLNKNSSQKTCGQYLFSS